jgi:hypothetical protein
MSYKAFRLALLPSSSLEVLMRSLPLERMPGLIEVMRKAFVKAAPTKKAKKTRMSPMLWGAGTRRNKAGL